MNELYHYGVLGMKWGVRKDRRYTDKEISEYRKRKIAEAPTKSESPRGANKGWYKNAPKSVLIREMRREESETSKKMNKKVNTRKDAFILKKGSYIHRSTYDSEDANRDGHAFATFKMKDAKGYASRNKLFSGGKRTFDLTMIAKEDLISPSRKERVSTFVELMVNDPKFKEAYQAQKQTYQLIKNQNKAKKIDQTIKGLEKEYEMFAVSLGGNEELRKRYFSELNKKGYNMVIDDADAGIISNSPIIVFDRKKSLEVVSINQVNREYLKQLGGGDKTNELYHYGVLGMKWGVRRYQNADGSLTSAGKNRYAEESSKSIKINPDGSKTIPKGFMFNRVGKRTMDVNKSGALYVSYGKEDAARYVKNLGPTLVSKLLGTSSEAVQHISVKKNLKMPSDTEIAKETANLLMSNSKLFNTFNESIYSLTFTGDFNKKLSSSDLQKVLLDSSGKSGQKLAYAVSSFLGNENYASESKTVYEHFRNKGYDAIPDVHDRLSGTSKTALIVINPDKLKVTSSTVITKDVMKEAKNYVKTLEKLKVSELIDD